MKSTAKKPAAGKKAPKGKVSPKAGGKTKSPVAKKPAGY